MTIVPEIGRHVFSSGPLKAKKLLQPSYIPDNAWFEKDNINTMPSTARSITTLSAGKVASAIAQSGNYTR